MLIFIGAFKNIYILNLMNDSNRLFWEHILGPPSRSVQDLCRKSVGKYVVDEFFFFGNKCCRLFEYVRNL